MTEWDGTERRTIQAGGREGRRPHDWHCGDHHMIQDSTKEHRAIVCSKIANLKSDSESDLEKLKEYHDKDMSDLKSYMEEKADAIKEDVSQKADLVEVHKKADIHEMHGVLRLIKILIGICTLIVAGQAIWLKGDISTVSSGIQRLNVRVSESMNNRIQTDLEQTKTLETITGQLGLVNYRLQQLEESHKEPRDGRDGKVGRDGRDAPK